MKPAPTTNRGRIAARLWPVAVVAVLAITVATNVAVLIAAHAPDAAVAEPDYYRKAVAHDSTLAERARSDALGWTAAARLTPGADCETVDVAIAAPDGPIDGAQVDVECIHNLDPTHPLRLTLAATGGGRYAALAPPMHNGLWELRITARRGAERFSTSLRTESRP
jgi:nitrogen fixation protein FixH